MSQILDPVGEGEGNKEDEANCKHHVLLVGLGGSWGLNVWSWAQSLLVSEVSCEDLNAANRRCLLSVHFDLGI